jgi:formylglycine-generating enzyme required for sulfatase activity
MAMAALAVFAAAAACDHSSTLPPLGEALVIVDTDAPVPLLVSRLRVDAFTTDGTWYATNDFSIPSPSNWPASFGVYSADPSQSKTVTLRLRAYVDGNTRDYLGERYMGRPSGANPSELTPLPQAPPGNLPRLISFGAVDITPLSEPQPLLAIDRLLDITVVPGRVESVRVMLQSACFGTMANLAERTTCIDTENEREAPPAAVLDPDLTVPTHSQQGTFGPAPCTAAPRLASTTADGTPLYDEEVCVPGGAFIFGTQSLPDEGITTAVPERIALIPPFRMDRYEVTVGRWRDALARGFVPPVLELPLPQANDAPFPTDPAPSDIQSPAFCTYTTAPMGRETYPITCITWQLALAFCQFEGGLLPTESQWEYAASMAGRAFKTAFPWGGPDDADPVCGQSVFGRGFDETLDPEQRGACTSAGFGPLPEAAAIYGTGHAPAGVTGNGDSSVGLGIADLGGNMNEYVLDTAYSLGSNCWMSQPLELPVCLDSTDPQDQNKSSRGAGWDASQQYNFAGYRHYEIYGEVSSTAGFRCVRSGTP